MFCVYFDLNQVIVLEFNFELNLVIVFCFFFVEYVDRLGDLFLFESGYSFFLSFVEFVDRE